jgi:hypothetical protein
MRILMLAERVRRLAGAVDNLPCAWLFPANTS